MKIENGIELLIKPDQVIAMNGVDEVGFNASQIRVVTMVNGKERWVCMADVMAHAVDSMEREEELGERA